jgi:hypothetical protein
VTKKKQPIEWATVSPTFGTAHRYGSCNAWVDAPKTDEGRVVCGYPRRANGTCMAGHPAQPQPEESTA